MEVPAPIIVAGDFNHDLSEDHRGFEDLQDAFDVAFENRPDESRETHITFFNDGVQRRTQLDGVFLANASKLFVRRAFVMKELSATGLPLSWPDSMQERNERASDHLPVWVRFQFRH